MSRELLGRVTVPSGAVLVVDTGSLSLWTHADPPVVPRGVLADDEATDRANDTVDLAISGPDAVAAGQRFDRDWHPKWIFDVPRDTADELCAAFIVFCERERLDATIAQAPRRVTHRERVALALAGEGTGGVSFHGLWAAAVQGLPPGKTLEVWADAIEEGPDEGRWGAVSLEVFPEAEVARTEEGPKVMVDHARLMFIDVDALAAWRHEEALDGLADFVFWGRDAKLVADAVGAGALESRSFGWVNVPVKGAVVLGRRVEEERETRGLRFATDFRPHSHHFQVLELIRESPTGSASLEVGGALLCAFATTWGDGIFPVFRDFDADGRLVRVRVVLASAEAEAAPTVH